MKLAKLYFHYRKGELMFLITFNKVVKNYGSDMKYWDNGYPVILTDEDKWMAYTAEYGVHEVSEVPEEVIPEKYCYTEAEGFYINPNWKEPNPDNTYEGVSDEVFEQILSDYREKLAEEVAGNGYNS